MLWLIIIEFTGSAANFGYNPYGNTVLGSGHLANPINACSPIDTPDYDEEWDSTPIIVVKRGNCTFVTKAMYA